jgi:hypothetical protein
MVRDIDDLRARAAGALEKYAAVQAKIAAKENGPSAGDLYVFKGSAAVGIEWALILQHPDDGSLWFMVPLDQNPMVGTWDVAVAESSEGGPGTLRCSRGIWVHKDDLWIGARSGFLEQWYVDKAKDRLAEIVNPERDPKRIRSDVDFDPEYEDWIDEVTAAAERLEAQLRAEPEVISIADFNTAWTASLPSRSYQAADMSMLVAESSGLGSPPAKEESPSPGHLLATQLPGTLVGIREGTAIFLLYFPTGSEPAPKVQLFTEGAEQEVTWNALPDGASKSVENLSTENTVLHLPDGTKKLLSSG